MAGVRGMRLGISLGLAVLVAACSKEQPAGTPLAYAPADTPYVIGGREPASQAVMDAWWERTAPIMAQYGAMIDEVMADAGDAVKHPLALALLKEFARLDSREAYAALGFDGQSRMALYGVGLTPVFRIELKDPAPLKALVGRAAAASGQQAPLANLGPYEYYVIDAEPVEVVLALGQGQLVATFWPKTADAGIKSQLLAASPPAKNILGTDRLQQIESRYGFQPLFSGYIDTWTVAERFIKADHPVDQALLALAKHRPKDALSEVCVNELRGMLTKAPRIVMGATRFDTRGFESRTVLELDATLARELVPVAASVPDLAGQAKWAGFAFGFNGSALLKFMSARAEAVRAAPFQCEHFAEMGAELDKAVQGLRGSTGFLNMAQGISLAVDALSIKPDQSGPAALDVSVLVASDMPQALLGMASMGLPEVAALGLEPNGVPKALPLDQVPAEFRDLGAAYAVMTDKAIAVRFAADDQGAGVQALPKLAPAPAGTVLRYVFSGEIYRLMGQAMRVGAAATRSGEQVGKMANVIEQYADVIGRIDTSLVLSQDGVEMRQTFELK